jgi:D-sedoheptulose 7-phosphate isomerase
MLWLDEHTRTQTHAHIARHVNEHALLVQAMAAQQSEPIARAALVITETILNGGKVLACGNGGSAAEASHLVAELVGRLERERPGLAAVALNADTAVLTALGNDYGFDAVFAKQVAAFGAAQDALVVISTSGASPNVLEAVRAAREREMRIVALVGAQCGFIEPLLRDGVDVLVAVPSARTMRVQEMHKLIVHMLCDWVDHCLLGEVNEM